MNATDVNQDTTSNDDYLELELQYGPNFRFKGKGRAEVVCAEKEAYVEDLRVIAYIRSGLEESTENPVVVKETDTLLLADSSVSSQELVESGSQELHLVQFYSMMTANSKYDQIVIITLYYHDIHGPSRADVGPQSPERIIFSEMSWHLAHV